MSDYMLTVSACISTSWEYSKTTRPYQAFEALATKIRDFVYPENELTKRRSFKFIPNFVVNALGYMTYHSVCPSYKTLKATEAGPDLEGLVDDVNKVFNKLVEEMEKKCPSTKNMSWEVRVKKDATVNAFCCPGGKVVITTGILTMMKGQETNEINRKDLIAAVLGHEITHAVAEHSAKSLQIAILSNVAIKCAAYVLSVLFVRKPSIKEPQQGQDKKKLEEEAEKRLTESRNRFCKVVEGAFAIPAFLLKTGHSQCNEFEADKFGIEIAHAAKYNIDASIALQQMFLNMKGESEKTPRAWYQKAMDVTASHPPSQERLQKNKETIKRLRRPA